VIGPATLEAVRTYQRAKALPVDGFPSLTILKRLRAEAPPPQPAGADQTGSVGQTEAPEGGNAAPANASGATPPAASGGGQPADVGQN
jgi:hypothetical protein